MQVMFYLQEVIKSLKMKIKKLIRPISVILMLALFVPSVLMGANAKVIENKETADIFDECESTAKNEGDDISIFLVTGIDNAGWNSDVIMLVSISKSLKKIGVLQIPRDSYINIDGRNYHKINAVYSEGCRRAYNAGLDEGQVHSAGSHSLSSFLERSLGIKINGHASVTTSGLSRIVDTLGGIDVNIPIDLSYDDNSQNLHIRLKAGNNHLNGDLAVKFVRCRKYANADYGRMSAQRMFMSAMLKKIKSEFSIKTMVNLFKSVYHNVNTDIELSDAVALAKTAFGIDEGDINMENLFGKSVKVGSAYCEVLNKELTNKKINSCLYFDKLSYLRAEFDPDGVFNNASDKNISRIYADRSYFMK